MNPTFVHLKTQPRAIINSSYIDLNDIGLLMTPKQRSDIKYRSYFGHSLNDPIMLSLFTGFTYNTNAKYMNRHQVNTDSTLYENALRLSHTKYGNTFFGFSNLSSLTFYFTLLYGLYHNHPDEQYRSKIKKEMELVDQVFMVTQGNKHVPYFTAMDSGDATYTASFNAYMETLVKSYGNEFIQTAIDNNPLYNKTLQQYKGKAVVLLRESPMDIKCSSDLGSDIFVSRVGFSLNRYMKNFLHDYMNDSTVTLPKMLKDSYVCHRPGVRGTGDIPINEQSVFTTMIDSIESVTVYGCELQYIAILRQDRDTLDLDVTLGQVYPMYHKQVSSMHPSGDFNASVVTEVDEYKYYQSAINKITKKLGIKASTRKKIGGFQKPDRFKMKIYYCPKSTRSTMKIIKWIAEQDKNAKISNFGYGRGRLGYQMESVVTGMPSIIKYCRMKSSELIDQGIEKKDNPYEKFLILCKDSYVNKTRFKPTKTIEFYSKGLLDDDALFAMITDTYLSGDKLTFTMNCDDIKQLKKLKLLGINFDNIEYDIADRKEILEYFEEY